MAPYPKALIRVRGLGFRVWGCGLMRVLTIGGPAMRVEYNNLGHVRGTPIFYIRISLHAARNHLKVPKTLDLHWMFQA